MKRRDFLTSSAGLGLAGALYPILGRTQAKPCPPSPLSVSGGTSVAAACNPGDAEADWLARSTGPGVVWAHDFRHAAEVDQFRYQGGIGNVPDISKSDGNCRRITSDGLTGGACLEINIPGNTLVKVVAATASNPIHFATDAPHGLSVGDRVRFVGLTGGFSALNDTSGGGGGTIVTQVISAIPTATSFEVAKDGSGYLAYAGGGTCSTVKVASSGWHRPFSAIGAGKNGLPEGDIGGVRGEHPLRDWTAATASNTDWRWRRDYYGHADYHKQYPTWSQIGGAMESDIWRGTDFWIQFRVKIAASRWTPGNPDGKLVFIETSAAQALQQIIIRSENTNAREGYPTQFPTKHFKAYTGGSYSKELEKSRSGVGTLLQPGGEYEDPTNPDRTCRFYSPAGSGRVSNYCWRWPMEEWVTVLVHVTPGHHYPGWGGAGNWPNNGDTGVQMWVARQSELANGYVKVLDVADFPFNYDSGGLHPPAWNLLKLSGYMNNVPAPVGWTHRFDQVILSQQFIPCPRA